MVNFKNLRQMIEVQGNGHIVTKEIKVSSFLRLHLSGKGTIEIHQSDEEKVVIETDENLVDYFDVTNSGRTLYVSAESKFKRPVFTKCLIKIYIRQMDVLTVRNEKADVVCPEEIVLASPINIKIQSVGNTSLNINAPSITLLCQCEGNVEMKGKCNSIKITTMMEGNFSAENLFAEDLSIKNMSEGNVEVYASKTISISHFGEGYIHYRGDALLKNVKQYGEGMIIHIK